MHPTEVKHEFCSAVFRKNCGPSTEHQMITHSLHCVSFFKDRMAKELMHLKSGQELVTLHHQYLNEMNTKTNEDGTLDQEKFNSIIQGIKTDFEYRMASQKSVMESELKNKPELQCAIDALPEKFKPFFDFLNKTEMMGNEMLKGKKQFTKEQLVRMIANTERDLEEIVSDNNLQIQKVSRMYSESNESHQMARMMLDTLHKTYVNILRGVRGG